MKIELHQSEINDNILYIEVSDGIRVETVTNKRSAMVTITTKHQLFDVSAEFRSYSLRQRTVTRRQVGGNVTNIGGNAHGPVMSGTFDGPVNISNEMPNYGFQGTFREEIRIGDIKDSSTVAIGRGASATNHRNINTGGGDYSEQNINKSGPPADILVEVPMGIAVLITNY